MVASGEKLLVHACCAPCLTTVVDTLGRQYSIIAAFYNPNIQPISEYKRRLDSMKHLCSTTRTELVVLDYDVSAWMQSAEGMEDEPEGGKRCEQCFMCRLDKTAQTALQLGIQKFTTTLTVSPHKRAETINRIGRKTAEKTGLEFMCADFKKNDGFKRSCELSSYYKLYRQRYCGCCYSARKLRGRSS